MTIVSEYHKCNTDEPLKRLEREETEMGFVYCITLKLTLKHE